MAERGEDPPHGGIAPGDADARASVDAEAGDSSRASRLSSLTSGLDDGLAQLASSWSSSLDGALQREILSSQIFETPPATIDRFVVERRLGAGASSVVFSCRDPLLERRVAIKVLARPSDGRLAKVHDQVIREARALAKIPHRNIVAIYEIGTWRDRSFIAMELIEGMTLASWLAAAPRTVPQILDAFLQAGRGLATAHAHGMVHRDFKPANVLVAQDGRVVVSDFGLVGEAMPSLSPDEPVRIATGSSSMHQAKAARPVGTPAYAAPEQRAGVEAHPSADVYSFALSLVEALLGYHPMPAMPAMPATPAMPAPPAGSAASPEAVAAAIASATTAWRAALRPRVSRRLYQELCAAAERDAAQRTSSLAPLLEALGQASSPAPPPRLRWLPWGIAALFLLLGLFVALGLAWSFLDRARDGDPRARDQESAVAPSYQRRPRPIVEAMSPRPLVLADNLAALLETPPAERDDRWRRVARTLLLMPLPTEVPCRWPAPSRTQAIVGGHVVSLDLHGNVTTCELATAKVAPLTAGVRCIQPDERGALVLSFTSGELEVRRFEAGSWVPMPTGAVSPAAPVSDVDGYCDLGAAAPGSSASQPLHYGRSSWGERRLERSATGELWFRDTATSAPRLLASGVTAFASDEALRTVVAYGKELSLFDLTAGVDGAGGVTLRDEVPVRDRRQGLRMDLSRNGQVAIVAPLDGPLFWWKRGGASWQRLALAQRAILGAQLSPGGSHALLLGHGGAMQVVELATGRRYPLAEAQIRRAHFLDDDRVVAADEAGRVWRWSLAAQRSLVISDHLGTGALWGLAISPDASAIASSAGGSPTDSAVRIASLRGEPLRELRVAPGAGIHALLFAGDQLLAGSNDGFLHSWRWPGLDKLAARELPRKAWVWSVAVARPGGGDPVEIIGMGRLTLPGLPLRGSPVLLAKGDVLRTVFTSLPEGNTGTDDLAVSADGRLVAASFSSGQLALIDVATGKVRAVRAHLGEARRVRFSDSFSRVVTIGDDGSLRSWSLTGEPLAELYIGHGQLYELEVSGTSALVGASDGHLGLWDLASQRLVHSYAGHSVGVSVARFDGTAQWLASADLSGRLCLRPRDHEDCHTELLGHLPGKPIRNARFLPDGRLATSSDDTTVRLWSPPYDLDDTELACELSRHVFATATTVCPSRR